MVTRSRAAALALGAALAAGPVTPLSADHRSPLVFGPGRNISQTAERSADPRLHVMEDGTLVVVWREGTVANAQVGSRRSVDRGQTFSSYQKVSSTPGPTYFPAVASNDLGNLFVTWREPLFPVGEIFFSRQMEPGGNFSTALNVSNSEGSSARSDLAVDGTGALYLVWDDAGQIAFVKSTDAGETFTDPIGFTEEDGLAGEATVAARGIGELVVAWTDLIDERYQVMFTRSLDAGNTFGRPRNLSRSADDATAPRVQMGHDGSLLAVYGQRDAEGVLYVAFRRSILRADGRERLTPARFLGRGGEPDLFADDRGGIYVVWNLEGEIFFSRSLNNGRTFSTPVNLSQTPGPPVPNEPGYSSSPSVTVSPRGDVFVAWQEVLADRNQEIVLMRALR